MIRLIAVTFWILTAAGCSGIKPMKIPNHREEGPPGGLFSGPEGAWTIGIGGKQAEKRTESATVPAPPDTRDR